MKTWRGYFTGGVTFVWFIVNSVKGQESRDYWTSRVKIWRNCITGSVTFEWPTEYSMGGEKWRDYSTSGM